VELRDIEYFAVVAERRHLGRAAEALGLSTPALSKSLRRLEAAAGTKLVKRTPKGVELTAAGSALFLHVRNLRLALRDVAQEVADIGQGRAGELRVGANRYSLDHILPAACDRLLREAPKVTVKVSGGGNDVLVPAARNGQLDLIIGYVPSTPEGLAEELLLTDEFIVHAAADHRLAQHKHVTPADVADERWAVGPENVPDWQWLHRAFEDNGLAPPRIAMETSATPLRLHAVASSGLLGFAPRLFVQSAARRLRLVELPVRELHWPCRLAVRYRKGAYLSPAARRFIEILKATAKEIAAERR
jgi:DNA-binding transcriptional LysR family regulator